jgi:hypothetical protein
MQASGVPHSTSLLQASGVPHSTSLLHTIQSLQTEVKELRAKQTSDKEAIIGAMHSLPQAVTNEILLRVQIDGAHPLTREEVQGMLTTVTSTIIERVDSIIGRTADAAPPPTDAVAVNVSGADATFDSWLWAHPNDKGQPKYHPCPQAFRFPSTSLKDLWILWHFGNSCERIRPYRFLSCNDLFDFSKDKQKLTKCKQLMMELTSIATENSLLPAAKSMHKLTLPESATVFDGAFEILLARIYEGSIQSRKGEQSVNTLYQRLGKWKNASANENV